MNWSAIGTPDASPRIPVPLTAEEISAVLSALLDSADNSDDDEDCERASALRRLADSIERRGK